jgi:hypothetical protein
MNGSPSNQKEGEKMVNRVLMASAALWIIAAFASTAALAQDAGEPPGAGAAAEPEAPAPPEGEEESSGEAGAAESGAGEVAPDAAPDAAPETAPAQPGTSGYKIPDIVKKIKALQKKIKQSQQRMDEVVSIVLNTSDTKGARAILALENMMSGSFVLIQAVVALDGAPIFKKSDDDGLLESGEMEVFNGAILPGEHTLSVLLVYRGAGYGIFSYLKGYRFKVRSTHKFKVKEGKGVKLTVVGYEKGDEETKMENRPAVKYVEEKISVD